jgi:hypothetical protein
MLKKFTVFKLNQPVDPQALRQALSRRPPSRPTADETTYGHAGYDQILSPVTEANTSMGALVCGAFVTKSIKIPSTLLRAEVEQETRIRLEVDGRDYLSRKEKQELLVEVRDRLRPGTPPTIQVYRWVIAGDLLLAEVTSQKQIDVFQAYMREALGQTPEHQLHRGEYRQLFGPESQEGLDADTLTCSLVDTNIWLVEGPLTFVGQGQGAEVVTLAKGNPFADPAFRSCLNKGMQLVKANLTYACGQRAIKSTVDTRTLAFTGIKYAADEENLDPVSQAQDKVSQMADLFQAWERGRNTIHKALTDGTIDRQSFLVEVGAGA